MKMIIQHEGPNRLQRRIAAADRRKLVLSLTSTGLQLVIRGAKTGSNRSRPHKVRTRKRA